LEDNAVKYRPGSKTVSTLRWSTTSERQPPWIEKTGEEGGREGTGSLGIPKCEKGGGKARYKSITLRITDWSAGSPALKEVSQKEDAGR